jgi:hypothetical protein
VLIGIGIAGQAALAAEVAVIQGALLATFYAFSANTRSLILQGHGELTAERLLAKRVVALPLLATASYVLCALATGVSPLLAVLLIVRRSLEWLAEVRLCEIEVADERRAAARAFGIQMSVTLGAALLLVFAPQASMATLAVYALSPLFSSLPRVKLAGLRVQTLSVTLRGAAPHIGSTAIEGISAYVLRLVVFLVAGREMSGLLFTAFVLGSFVASLFANVLGPTLALRRPHHGAGVAAAALAMGTSGLALSAASIALAGSDWLGKPGYFWLALGLSLLGGAVMIGAQVIRLRLFDERRADVLFGPDVLRNLTAIVAAPALYYLVAPTALGALYLTTALLTLFFFWGARRDAVPGRSTTSSALLHGLIAAALLLPLFFLLDGRVYRDPPATPVDLGASLMTVPLPLSLAACFAGIVLLARYRHAGVALGTLFFLFVAMVLASVVASEGDLAYESRKFILLFQFLLPAFALVLGQMFGALPQAVRIAALAFVVVLLVVIPLQLIRSIGYHEGLLSDDLWLFGVYQHLQYVPTVLVCAYLVALYGLWDMTAYRRLLVIGAPLMGGYAASSFSMTTIALLIAGALVLMIARWRDTPARWCAALAVATCIALLTVNRDSVHLNPRLETLTAVAEQPQGRAAAPGQMHLHYWTLFGRGAFESTRSALFGHPRAIDRDVAPSAYNYYLDFVYNFGVLGFLPFIWVVGYTVLLLWRQRSALRELPLLGLAGAVLFVLAIDNMFKVPLRQPYPGIFFFFLWGLLLAQLQTRSGRLR